MRENVRVFKKYKKQTGSQDFSVSNKEWKAWEPGCLKAHHHNGFTVYSNSIVQWRVTALVQTLHISSWFEQ